jgi:hypothetical protein
MNAMEHQCGGLQIVPIVVVEQTLVNHGRKKMNSKFQGKRAEIGVYDDAMNIGIPYLIINCQEEYPPQLNENITVSLEYINPNNPEQNFTCSDATLTRRIKEEKDGN